METTRIPSSVVAALAVSVFAYASSSILVRLAGDAAPSVSLVTMRSAMAVVLLAPVCFGPFVRERTRLSARGWMALVGAGALLALHFVLWFESLRHTSVASSTVLVTTTPLWLGAYAMLRGQPPGRLLLAALLFGVGGAALLGWADGRGAVPGAHPLLGNALALGAAVTIAAYLLIGQRLRQRLSWGAYVLPLFACVALFSGAYAVLRGAPLVGLSAETYAVCLAMAVGPQIAGHGAVNYAVRFVSPLMLGLLSLLEPIGASLIAYLLWKEAPPALGLAGMALTLVGIGLAMTAQRRT
ncbi:MAG: DMT family transporter [Rhodothermales bacterium]|nr:DMT family transporter [Rhodothermales bacterium]